jgi:hypothetical protein
MAARAAVEALLRDRKLDRTLTTTLPDRLGEDAVAALGTDTLDRALSGGLPRGHVSEVAGPASSGRTSLAWAALAAATQRGESVALIDTFDRFDPPTAHACGIELSRLLWVRGQAVPASTGAERAIDRAIKAVNLVVQSGVCTLVVIDLIDAPAVAIRRLPMSTWFRIARAIEGSETVVVLLAAHPVARSAGGRSIQLAEPAPSWTGDHDRTRRLGGVRSRSMMTSARSAHTACVAIHTGIVHTE